jgi:hypothetical protein
MQNQQNAHVHTEFAGILEQCTAMPARVAKAANDDAPRKAVAFQVAIKTADTRRTFVGLFRCTGDAMDVGLGMAGTPHCVVSVRRL